MDEARLPNYGSTFRLALNTFRLKPPEKTLNQFGG